MNSSTITPEISENIFLVFDILVHRLVPLEYQSQVYLPEPIKRRSNVYQNKMSIERAINFDL